MSSIVYQQFINTIVSGINMKEADVLVKWMEENRLNKRQLASLLGVTAQAVGAQVNSETGKISDSFKYKLADKGVDIFIKQDQQSFTAQGHEDSKDKAISQLSAAVQQLTDSNAALIKMLSSKIDDMAKAADQKMEVLMQGQLSLRQHINENARKSASVHAKT